MPKQLAEIPGDLTEDHETASQALLTQTSPRRKAELFRVVELIERITTAEARMKDIQQTLRECLEPIEKWTRAYPFDVFPEPDMKEVRRMLGDTLLTQLSASNMRHVITRVWEMLEQARTLLPPDEQEEDK